MIPVAPVDKNAAAASGVEMPPQMRISGDIDDERNISLAAEYMDRVDSPLTNPEASHPFRAM
jgi:hypothetical protein